MATKLEAGLVRLLRQRRDELRGEAASADEERAYLQAEYARRESQLRERVERLERELVHVEQLLELREGSSPNGKAPPRLPGGRRIEDAVYDLISAEGRGLHYKVILERLGDAGVPVAGSNPSATLVARLIRDGRFCRPEQRGVYSLREWAPSARNVGARKKSRRVKARQNQTRPRADSNHR